MFLKNRSHTGRHHMDEPTIFEYDRRAFERNVEHRRLDSLRRDAIRRGFVLTEKIRNVEATLKLHLRSGRFSPIATGTLLDMLGDLYEEQMLEEAYALDPASTPERGLLPFERSRPFTGEIPRPRQSVS